MQTNKDALSPIGDEIFQLFRFSFFALAYIVLFTNIFFVKITYSQLFFAVAMYVISITLTLVDFDSQHIRLLADRDARIFRHLVKFAVGYSLVLVFLIMIAFKSNLASVQNQLVLNLVKFFLFGLTFPVFCTNLWRLTLKDDSDKITAYGLKNVEELTERDLNEVLAKEEATKLDIKQIRQEEYNDFVKKRSHAKKKKNKGN